MMVFTRNDWGQHDIINNIIVFTKQGADMVYAITLAKNQK